MGWRTDNPVKRIERYHEEKRDRWLSAEELRRLCDVLERHPNQRAANAIRFQRLTGVRLGEVLSARKDAFDLARGVWTKPSHQTKQKRTEHVPLSGQALALLAVILEASDLETPCLFPGNVPGQPLKGIESFRASALRQAGIDNYRHHDNRHTYASHLVSSGLSLELVGRLLGPTTAATTKRHAHLADDPLRAATERFGAKIPQAFYSVRSERQLMEQLDCNLLLRWFVGVGVGDPVWDVTVFTKNRERLLKGDVAAAFFRAVLERLPASSKSSPPPNANAVTRGWRSLAGIACSWQTAVGRNGMPSRAPGAEPSAAHRAWFLNPLAGFEAVRSIPTIIFLILSMSGHGGTAVAAPEAEPWARWEAHDPQSRATIDHGVWGELLERHLVSGDDGVNRLDYTAFTPHDRAALAQYIGSLAVVPISRYDRAEQMAYWINLYNVLTLQVVLDHYPVDSIRDIDISPGLFSDGPWGRKLIEVEGERLSLDDIEHRILRPTWRDPRVHYAVNCAALGCPNLQIKPFQGATIEAQLEVAARAYVNHPRGVQVEAGDLVVSRIYDWFMDDFGATEQDVIRHLRSYANPGLEATLRGFTTIDDYRYDWSLNDARRR